MEQLAKIIKGFIIPDKLSTFATLVSPHFMFSNCINICYFKILKHNINNNYNNHSKMFKKNCSFMCVKFVNTVLFSQSLEEDGEEPVTEQLIT